MKKLITVLSISILFVLLAACGAADEEESQPDEDANNQNTAEQEDNEEAAEEDLTEIVVGASSTPHAEILEVAAPILEEEGIKLDIEIYQDFVFPNDDLDGEILDANYFQHIPYLETTMEDKGYDFVNLGAIHIEPMGIYSGEIEKIDDVTEGTVVIMSNSVSDHGRILSLLEREGLIKLDENVDKVDAEISDVAENPLNLEFDAEVDPGFLPEFYEREQGALVAINTNYAIEAGLTPEEDAVILEETDSPYVNIVAARAEDEDSEALQTLVDVLRSEEIQSFIEEEYEGAVIPVTE